MAPNKKVKSRPTSKQGLHQPSAKKTKESHSHHVAAKATARVLRSSTLQQQIPISLDSTIAEEQHKQDDKSDLSIIASPELDTNDIVQSEAMVDQPASICLPKHKPKLHSRMKDKQNHVSARAPGLAKAIVEPPPKIPGPTPVPDSRDSLEVPEHARNRDVAPSVRHFQPSKNVSANLYHDLPGKQGRTNHVGGASIISEPRNEGVVSAKLPPPIVVAGSLQKQSEDHEVLASSAIGETAQVQFEAQGVLSSPLSSNEHSPVNEIQSSNSLEESIEEQSEDESQSSNSFEEPLEEQPEDDELPFLSDSATAHGECSSKVKLPASPVARKLGPASANRKELLSPTSTERESAIFKETLKKRDEATKMAEAEKTEWMAKNTHKIWTGRMKHAFKGWVELEADPDYFTIMLKRLGVEKAKVVEIHSLDEMLVDHHCLKYGIMFLSRYHDEELPPPDEPAPKELWFTNQTVDNACATVGILNIVNNVKSLDLGENLRSFKNFTKDFNGIMKGEALANFTWCQSIHNAFAKRTEMLAANMSLKEAAKTTVSASRKRKRKPKADGSEVPNHYVAYVPFEGSLWKLDGLDLHAHNIGPLHDGESWLEDVKADIQKRMSLFADDSTAGYTILAIVEDKLPSLIESLGRSVNYLNWTEYCIDEKRGYWHKSTATHAEDNEWPTNGKPIRGADFRYGLTMDILDRDGVCMTKDEKIELSSCSEEHLTLERPLMVKEQLHLRAIIPPLLEESKKQWAKYKDRMFDYGPVIQQWLLFLKENGKLDALINRHAQGVAGLDEIPEEFQAAVELNTEAPDRMQYSDATDEETAAARVESQKCKTISNGFIVYDDADVMDIDAAEEDWPIEDQGDEEVEADEAEENEGSEAEAIVAGKTAADEEAGDDAEDVECEADGEEENADDAADEGGDGENNSDAADPEHVQDTDASEDDSDGMGGW